MPIVPKIRDCVIRPLESPQEFNECVTLQRSIWGEHYVGEFTPALLWVVQQIGGVVAGSFDIHNKMTGIVLGISGLRGGHLVHWSHMLGVKPQFRNRNLGFHLKLYQRDHLLAVGVNSILGTFDPLNSTFAHLLLSKLGAVSRCYVRDAYPMSQSPLHRGIGTDRLLSEWQISTERVRDKIACHKPKLDISCISAIPKVNSVYYKSNGIESTQPDLSLNVPIVSIIVPSDIMAIQASRTELAFDWRQKMRIAFESYFSRGFCATEIFPDGDISRYLLEYNFNRLFRDA